MRRILQSSTADGRPPPPASQQATATNTAMATSSPDPPAVVDSDVVVILASLLCALICVVGLAAVARCARSRGVNAADTPGATATVSPSVANKGIKKKDLRSLPKLAYEDAVAAAAAARGGASGAAADEPVLSECPICLSEFAGGDEVRVMPQCGHGFHVACVDTWLASHSSCPSCRTLLVLSPQPAPPAPARSGCQKCSTSGTAAFGSISGSFPP